MTDKPLTGFSKTHNVLATLKNYKWWRNGMVQRWQYSDYWVTCCLRNTCGSQISEVLAALHACSCSVFYYFCCKSSIVLPKSQLTSPSAWCLVLCCSWHILFVCCAFCRLAKTEHKMSRHPESASDLFLVFALPQHLRQSCLDSKFNECFFTPHAQFWLNMLALLPKHGIFALASFPCQMCEPLPGGQ